MRFLMSFAELAGPQPAALHRWLSIVGIGEDGVEGLSPAGRELIQSATVVFGGARHLALAASLIRGVARPWTVPFDPTVAEVLSFRGQATCVLASGDPFFYGVGGLLSRHVAREETTVVPAPSAFSLAASRLLWPLAQTCLLSLCGRSLDFVRPHLQPGARILLLTSDHDAAAKLARLLCEIGFGRSRVTVLESLAGPRERIRSAPANAFALDAIGALNTVAIEVVHASFPEQPAWPMICSNTTDRSRSARSERSLCRRWRRAAASSSGTWARGRDRSRSNGCSPTSP
jgi:precorrin-6B C5,15-methyltransferase / cobalt-precorrin-6B C5,C15-methyltransferase